MTNQSKQQLLVWWVLWAAFQTGVFMLYNLLGSPSAQVSSPALDPSLWFVGIAPVALSVVIRWFVLPRAKSAQSAFPLFVIGIAMAEASCFFGLFLFPAHKQELFLLSVLGILQFVPFFARRFFTCDKANEVAGK